MPLLDQRILGIAILFLLGMLATVKRVATGSILDKPQGNQLGGSAPRSGDKMVMDGPYGLIRHPMYIAALSISLGLAGLVQSAAFLIVFLIYVLLISLLILMEENELHNAYGEHDTAYQQKARKLILFVY